MKNPKDITDGEMIALGLHGLIAAITCLPGYKGLGNPSPELDDALRARGLIEPLSPWPERVYLGDIVSENGREATITSVRDDVVGFGGNAMMFSKRHHQEHGVEFVRRGPKAPPDDPWPPKAKEQANDER